MISENCIWLILICPAWKRVSFLDWNWYGFSPVLWNMCSWEEIYISRKTLNEKKKTEWERRKPRKTNSKLPDQAALIEFSKVRSKTCQCFFFFFFQSYMLLQKSKWNPQLHICDMEKKNKLHFHCFTIIYNTSLLPVTSVFYYCQWTFFYYYGHAR